MIVIWIRTNYAVIDTKSITVITISGSTDFRSFITKSILIVFYYVYQSSR